MNKFFQTVLLASLLLTITEAADAEVFISDSGTGGTIIGPNSQTGARVLGWQITIGPESLTLIALGTFDEFSDGLVIPMMVGVWDTASEELLASVTVGAGTSPELIGEFRYADVAGDVTLEAGKSYTFGTRLAVGGISRLARGRTGVVTDSVATFASVGGSFVSMGLRAATFELFGVPLDSQIPVENLGDQAPLMGPNFQFEIKAPLSPTFELKQILTANQQNFGTAVALDGNQALVASAGITGSAALFNILNGEFLQAFDNPNPGTSGTGTDFYAFSVGLSNGRVLVSAHAEGVAATDSGAVYMFDGDTGVLLHTFTHPNPIPEFGGIGFGQGFGRDIAVNGDYLLVGTQMREVFLFDLVTGELLFTFSDPSNPSLGILGFGTTVALSDQLVAIGEISDNGAAGAVHLFDRGTGTFLRTLFNPTPDPACCEVFGDEIALDDDQVLIGAPQATVDGLRFAGEAYLYDANTGQLLHTFADPAPTFSGFFGNVLDVEGELIAITNDVIQGVRVFNAVSGDLFQTLTEPSTSSFGRALDLDQGNLLVGSLSGFRRAFLYGRGLNQSPTADAGVDQAVRAGDTIFLDGSASFDDNTAAASLEYAWSFVSLPVGSAATLSAANTATPNFVVDVAGTYAIQLVVTDEGGLPSTPDDVIISSDNLAPTADAGIDRLVVVGSVVTLDGGGSTDPELDPLTYSWMFGLVPFGSTAPLIDANTASPSFIPDLEGLFEATLVVSDFIGPGAPDSVGITVVSSDQFAIISIVSAGETIVELPAGQVTTQGNQNALMNFLTQATVAIQEGDLAEAINKLQKALSRTDGCVLRGSPDGNGSGRDWITDCSAQMMVYDSLHLALTTLTP